MGGMVQLPLESSIQRFFNNVNNARNNNECYLQTMPIELSVNSSCVWDEVQPGVFHPAIVCQLTVNYISSCLTK